jgi:hypothetical protein
MKILNVHQCCGAVNISFGSGSAKYKYSKLKLKELYRYIFAFFGNHDIFLSNISKSMFKKVRFRGAGAVIHNYGSGTVRQLHFGCSGSRLRNTDVHSTLICDQCNTYRLLL